MDIADLMTCQFCGGQIDPQFDYQAIRGWEGMREHGDLHWARVASWACASCIRSFHVADNDADDADNTSIEDWCRLAAER
jgi:hypothetical protein